VLDLLGQLADAGGAGGAGESVRATARKAMTAVNRGVLAYQSIT
jgi:ATP-dependent RNA helicase HelY